MEREREREREREERVCGFVGLWNGEGWGIWWLVV
jgi:hypothetical protein